MRPADVEMRGWNGCARHTNAVARPAREPGPCAQPRAPPRHDAHSAPAAPVRSRAPQTQGTSASPDAGQPRAWYGALRPAGRRSVRFNFWRYESTNNNSSRTESNRVVVVSVPHPRRVPAVSMPGPEGGRAAALPLGGRSDLAGAAVDESGLKRRCGGAGAISSPGSPPHHGAPPAVACATRMRHSGTPTSTTSCSHI